MTAIVMAINPEYPNLAESLLARSRREGSATNGVRSDSISNDEYCLFVSLLIR